MNNLQEPQPMSQAANEMESMVHSLEGDSECANCGHDRTFHLTYLGDEAQCDHTKYSRGRPSGLCGCKKFVEVGRE